MKFVIVVHGELLVVRDFVAVAISDCDGVSRLTAEYNVGKSSLMAGNESRRISYLLSSSESELGSSMGILICFCD